ncbi:MAG: tRNA (N(6)-L-threonylcarbamoyladenosine(37)-C(2))-methylthiotransferase MtaB, partial [Clostridia bacterium]|nr:tRNA (N(6)-L-threonylcarbamoyladenosine(37)-C(2))-methylthiotransferase MtaB [Clostridia bacterium]
MNQYDTETLAELFAGAGYGIADAPAGADVIVVNSCTVTAEADRKTRQAVRRFRRLAPGAVVVLCGCMPQAFPDTADALPEADIVTGNRDHRLILTLVENFSSRLTEIPVHQKGDPFENFELSTFKGRTRAIIKIQDGCDRYCSYCIIPTSRGRSRSRSLESLSA